MPKCGNCKENHLTAADVKLCYSGDNTVRVTVKSKAVAPSKSAEKFGCECGGSGRYYSGGAVVNGVYTGKIGVCFRCRGKGYQTEQDRKRNWYYDNFVRKVHI